MIGEAVAIYHIQLQEARGKVKGPPAEATFFPLGSSIFSGKVIQSHPDGMVIEPLSAHSPDGKGVKTWEGRAFIVYAASVVMLLPALHSTTDKDMGGQIVRLHN